MGGTAAATAGTTIDWRWSEPRDLSMLLPLPPAREARPAPSISPSPAPVESAAALPPDQAAAPEEVASPAPVESAAALPVDEDAPPDPAASAAMPPIESVPALPAEGSADAPAPIVYQLASGEVAGVDGAQRTLTVKLYSAEKDKTLTVNFDDETEIEGVAGPSFSSLQSGAAIDVRYDPQTGRATYVYVY